MANNNFDDLFKEMFGFNGEEDFDEDTQETEIDRAKLTILEQMRNYLDKTVDAVKYHEPQNENANFNILARYVKAMIDIQNLEGDDEISEEEKVDKIKAIEFSVNDMSLEDAIMFDEGSYDEEQMSGEDIINKFVEKQQEEEKKDNESEDSDTDW